MSASKEDPLTGEADVITRQPTPDEARTLLRSSESAAGSLREIGGNRHAPWLTGHAISTFASFTAMGAADSNQDVAIASIAFGLVTVLLAVGVLAGVGVSKAGMARRWIAALVSWGVLHGAAMIIGAIAFKFKPWFWLPAGVLAALPLVIGAWRENRA